MIDPLLPEQPAAVISARILRQFAGLWLLIFGGLACWHGLFRGSLTTGYVLGFLAVTVGVLGLLNPQAVQPIYKGGIALTYPIGWVVSNVLMIGLFCLVVTPLGLLLKLLQRDVLCLRHNPGLQTYWTKKPNPTNMAGYYRQS